MPNRLAEFTIPLMGTGQLGAADSVPIKFVATNSVLTDSVPSRLGASQFGANIQHFLYVFLRIKTKSEYIKQIYCTRIQIFQTR